MKKITVQPSGATTIEYDNPGDALEHLIHEMHRTYGSEAVKTWLAAVVSKLLYLPPPGDTH